MTGIEKLRSLVYNAGYSGEWAFDGFDMNETINLLLACKDMDLETFPDELNEKERKFAARTGRLSVECMRRLYKHEGLKYEGSHDEQKRRKLNEQKKRRND